jgi:uncharacterized protein (DUF1330 family)
MAGYAVAHIREVTVNADIVKYLEEIDATLRPFGGRFAIHGGDVEVLEGAWPGHVVLIEFPDRDSARASYPPPRISPSFTSARTIRKAISCWPTASVRNTEPPTCCTAKSR